MKISLGPFELYNPIGKGGMGEVWEGLHVPQQMPVAIKVVTSNEARREVFHESFRTEIRAVAQLDHPGIVAVVDYGEVPAGAAEHSQGRLVEGSPYIVMELAKRGSLLNFQNRISWPETKNVLLTVLDALAHAHASGLIHRDLKPANILIGCGDGSHAGIKLTDFGLAHTIDAIEEDERNAWGTPHYMAPEQFRGAWREYGPWTDLYSLGVMAYQMISGRYPFEGNSRIGIAHSHILSNPKPAAPRFDVPEGFEAWISRLLQKAPEDRFRTAADAAWSLKSLGDPEPREGRTVSILSVGFDSREGSSTAGQQTLTSAPEGGVADTIFDRPLTTHLADRVGTSPFGAIEGDSGFAAPMNVIRAPLPWTWKRSESGGYSRSLIGAGLGLFGLRSVRMIAREDERDEMWETLEKVADDRTSRCVLLRGDAGTGKSRLAEWLSRRADEVGSAIQVRARFSPLAMADDAISESFQHIFRVVGCEEHEKVSLVTSKLAHLGVRSELEVDACLNAFVHSNTEVDADFRFALFARVLGLIAIERPVVLWLDDVHWGEEGALLAKFIIDQAADAPIFVVATVRGDLVGGNPGVVEALNALHQHPRCTMLDIEPLDPTATQSLVRDLLHLEPGLAAEVASRSGGSPLFAVQLIGDWVQRGFLKFGREGFELKPGVKASVPDDIHELWAARIRLLLRTAGPEDSTALELAAALGHTVAQSEWSAACAIANVRPPVQLLRVLTSSGFAIQDREGWTFSHGMMRESIERTSRESGTWESVNRFCVQLLEQMYPDRQWPFHERYASHLIESGNPDDALESILIVSRTKARRGEFGEAHRWLDRHRALCADLVNTADDVRPSERWICRAELMNLQGHHRSAIPFAQRAEVEARKRSWPKVLRLAMLQEGRAQLFAGDLHVASRIFEKTKALMKSADDLDNEAACCFGLARACEHLGSLDAALEHLNEALRGFEAVSNSHGVAECYNAFGDVYRAKRDFEESHKWVERALNAYRAMSNPIGVADSVNDQSVLYRLEGQLEDARETCETALKMYQSVGAGQSMFVKMHLGWILTHEGKFGQARQLFDESRVYFYTQDQVGLCAECCVLSLKCLLELGETVLVARRVGEAVQMLDRSGWKSLEVDEAVALLWEQYGTRDELGPLFELVGVR